MSESLTAARALAVGATQAEFVAQFPYAVFVLDSPSPPLSVGNSGFRTGVIDTTGIYAGPAETQLFHLKRADGKQTSSMSVGRTPSCDVQLDTPAVSKLHAFVQLSATKSGYILTDNDSSNGTWVNDVKLVANQPQPLKMVTRSISRTSCEEDSTSRLGCMPCCAPPKAQLRSSVGTFSTLRVKRCSQTTPFCLCFV